MSAPPRRPGDKRRSGPRPGSAPRRAPAGASAEGGAPAKARPPRGKPKPEARGDGGKPARPASAKPPRGPAKEERPQKALRVRKDGSVAVGRAPRAAGAGATEAPPREKRTRTRDTAPSVTSAPATAITSRYAPRQEPQRIAKLLARAGIASRREIERMIEERRIALNGTPLETPATILTSLAGITVDGKPVEAPGAARLFLFHKPTGFLTTERDPRGRPTIYDRLPKDLPRLMPVGRLDMNTEGLLLLTTDGELKRKLELPSSGIPRIYRARAYGNVTQDQLEALIDGITIDGVRYGSIDANMERRTGANLWIEVKITEGKNREVRRVLEYLGLQVSRLIRVAYGTFLLGDLPAGEIGEVRQHDLVEFRKSLR